MTPPWMFVAAVMLSPITWATSAGAGGAALKAPFVVSESSVARASGPADSKYCGAMLSTSSATPPPLPLATATVSLSFEPTTQLTACTGK